MSDEAEGRNPGIDSDIDHLALGRLGEELAAEFLQASGFNLVAANYAVPVGRSPGGAQAPGGWQYRPPGGRRHPGNATAVGGMRRGAHSGRSP